MVTRDNGESNFSVLAAVDLLGEQAVRLERGRFDRVVACERDPEALVRRFSAAGAELVHVVDLDGARSGSIRPELVRRLVHAAAPTLVQASGGIRTADDALAVLEAGAARVVIGTAAVAGRTSLAEFVETLGNRLVVALDARAGHVATRGWTSSADLSVEDAVARCVAAGVPRLLCTAVERDGTLSGPDLELLTSVVEWSGLPVVAAGGVRSAADLDAIERIGCEGAIVGRALLEGQMPLSELRVGATRSRARSPAPWQRSAGP